MKKVAFIGHRDIIGIEDEIYTEIKKLKQQGITEFYSGGMGNFDKMCEYAVKKAGCKITFIPYNKNIVKTSDFEWYDEIICPNNNSFYSRYDIPNRNKWLVENCDVFLCYVYRQGGAMKTFQYAKKRNKTTINIYDNL